MGKTGNEIFEMASALIYEGTEDDKESKAFTKAFLNIHLQECLAAENSIRRSRGETELSEAPWVTDLTKTIDYHDAIQTYYARNDAGKPWTHVLRARDAGLAERIAVNMTALAENDNIGYSQKRRMTAFNSARANGGDISKATGDVDCSSGVSGMTQLAGGNVKANLATSNMLAGYKASKQFDILTDAKYLNSADYLRRGDILLRLGHTAVILDDGIKAESQEDDGGEEEALPTGAGHPMIVDDYHITEGVEYGVKQWCRVRKGPTLDDDILGKAYRGETYDAYDLVEDWIRINYHGRVGYIYKVFLSEVEG